MNRILAFMSFLLLLISACKKEEDNKSSGDLGYSVLVCNEGNFGWGNGSLSLMKKDKTVVPDIFNAENGFLLGDVVQSLTADENGYFIVVNNSSKVVYINKEYKYQYSIQIPSSSPRYLVKYGNKAFVSDLYANNIWVLDLNSKSVSGSINVSGWSEDLCLVNGYLYAMVRTKPGATIAKRIYRINPQTNSVIDFNELADVPTSMCSDGEKLWIALASEIQTTTQIVCFNTSIQSFQQIVSFPQMADIKDITAVNGKVFFLSDHINTFDGNQSQRIVDGSGKILYSLQAFDGGRLVYSDVKDYTQPSDVYIADFTGKTLHTFTAGINSSGFLILP